MSGILLCASPVLGRLILPCGDVLTPDSAGYANATYIDNMGRGRARLPAIVAQARCVEDVPVAISYARNESMPFAVKGGGHSAAGYSLTKGGLVLDMSQLNASAVERGPAGPKLHVQAGARFGQLYARLKGTGLLFPGGGCSDVGVSGYVLGGGLSFLSRAYGLASDNLLSARLVLANGTVRNCSAGAHSELFWALRGALIE